ncbi:hypothetical protein [Rhodococcus sp. IEGM 1330]|uniref:hypothetical protein n=1 Tax=Rhodococcus sp. IEGM 1330 TaxID=3082225 RepID=UPI0029546265|nr:hypothetical protein [Rhodococcus sp. IEGM 1330]MDV8023095.1 hypothetical protein [Rhodococcus sp. IEGM 1330]
MAVHLLLRGVVAAMVGTDGGDVSGEQVTPEFLDHLGRAQRWIADKPFLLLTLVGRVVEDQMVGDRFGERDEPPLGGVRNQSDCSQI